MYKQKLKELGHILPSVPTPLAAYIPGNDSSHLIFTSGQLPFISGELLAKGRLGEDVSIETGQKAAEIAVMNCLGVADSLLQGGLDAVKKIVKMTVFVSCTPNFYDHPKVANGASELLVKIFGDAGKHARAAVGVASLPLNSPVEIELIIEGNDSNIPY